VCVDALNFFLAYT